ncbi:MAG: host attachment family protein [Pseudomonadota bacterium]
MAKALNGSWVVVADGAKHLLLRNHGDEELLDLRVLHVDERRVAGNADIGADRPGRFPVRGGRKSSVAQADWKGIDKAEFAARLAQRLNEEAAAGDMKPFVLLADARTLGALRQHLSKSASSRLSAEIVGDFAHLAIDEIEKAIAGSGGERSGR